MKCLFHSFLDACQSSPTTKEPEYETLPRLLDKNADKKGWFRFSKHENKNQNSKEGFDNKNQSIQTTADYATVNKNQQEAVKRKQECTDPHYEELPLPDENQLNQWKQQAEVKSTNDGNINEAFDIQIPDEHQNKQVSKSATYEDIPPLKDNKRKGIFRLSKAFKNDGKDIKQESKRDPKISANSDRFSNQNEMPNIRESMLNPRDKLKKDDPANKYPFYEELPPIRDPKKTESSVDKQQSNVTQPDRNSSSQYYHVLEANTEGEMCDNSKQNAENEDGPRYFILEKVRKSKIIPSIQQLSCTKLLHEVTRFLTCLF